jgi:hypothetical protein
MSGGSGQWATLGTQFALALQARVTDAYGNLVPDVTVTFTAPAQTQPTASVVSGTFEPPGGKSSAASVVETADTGPGSGVASADPLHADNLAGPWAVNVTVDGVQMATINMTNSQ